MTFARTGVSDRGYLWDAPLKSIADLDRADGDPTKENESSITRSAESSCVTEDWHARYLDLAAKLAALVDAVPAAAERGHRGAAFELLRPTVGGFATLLDVLHRVPTRATDTAPTASKRYIECVHWWFGRLLADLRDAIGSASDDARLDERIVAAADFAALYGLSHLARLHDELERSRDDPLREACRLVQREVRGLTWQLRDLADG